MQRRGTSASQAADQWPAHFVAFEAVFTARRLTAPWALCPSTTDQAVVNKWLTWTTVGVEGVVFKRPSGSVPAFDRARKAAW
jgi:hypothetical protein